MNVKSNLLKYPYFIENEYLDKYCNLIEINRNHPKIKHITNKHHIIPKCLFKLENLPIDNSSSNLVNLKYSDHILAHYYLYKCSNSLDFQHSNGLGLLFLYFKKSLEELCEYEIINHQEELDMIFKASREYALKKGKEWRDSLSKEEFDTIYTHTSNVISSLKTYYKDDIEVRIHPEDIPQYEAYGFLPGRNPMHIEKVSNFPPGNIPWNKGLKYSDKLSPEARARVTEISRNHTMSESSKQIISEKNKGKIYVFKDDIVTTINPKDLENYILEGWTKGNPNCNNTKGKISIHKDNVRKMINPEELSNYINLGWKQGTGLHHCKGRISPTKGSYWITNGKENQVVNTLDNIPNGWYRGRITSKSKKD